MAACKDQLISIPLSSDDVLNTLEHLPRTPREAGLMEVKLKRKKEYKNCHQQAYIDPEKIFKSLDFLKAKGHPDYSFYADRKDYERRCMVSSMQKFVNDSNVEQIIEKDEYIKSLNKNQSDNVVGKMKVSVIDDANVESIVEKLVYEESFKECTEDNEGDNSDKEEEDYKKNDVIRKFQFDYDSSVCLVDKFPEAAITDESIEEPNKLSLAPGEGKSPEDILSAKNWDIKAFPMKHPDGQNGLHWKRKRKLTDQYYFVQRMRNKDTRFSKDPGYVFAAAAYLEKKQLQRNVNISFQRGKEVRSKEGISTYHLDDAFSVFNNISNTPKYWKTAKYEMLAKLDNLGPFNFFFTLSCADLRWDENFSSILRKLGVTIEYETNSEDKNKTYVLYDNNKKMELREYLDKYIDKSRHELIRRHIYIATRNYNNRVKSFIRDIVMDKNNPMSVKHWSTNATIMEFYG